ncbi:Ankyrin repeat and SOCS box protein 3 [Merluccius polli]|uniref:Ankyrin repeat and SOCS box protein 3 n=1 Tax=Merluccius polli TaxID=89951 RepID=A0AA47NRI5_MERPO|nr:Ankyrin repeat and SOCS box protein 3 [Merluccius polli]
MLTWACLKSTIIIIIVVVVIIIIIIIIIIITVIGLEKRRRMDFSESYSDTVSSVAAAARSGRGDAVRRLIRGGCSVDARDNRGWDALHEAAAAGSRECVVELLSAAGSSCGRRSYVNSLTHKGESALYLAAKRGHMAVTRLLLKAHADINQCTDDLSCPLFAAVDGGHKEVVQLLVSKGAEVNGTHTACCWTCLHHAVYKGYRDIVCILICVCHLEAVDDHNITPLFVAAQYGRHECLEILVGAGADVNAQADDLATPLMLASQEGHERCVEILVEHGADPNLACSREWPQLPIHAAAEFGHCRILERLMAITDRVCDQGEGMVSPLYMAVKKPSQSMALLLREGYSPDGQDCNHILGFRSPLSFSLSLTPTAGARLNEDDWMHALALENTELLELILQHRRIPDPGQRSGAPVASDRPPGAAVLLSLGELRGLVCVALSAVRHAPRWLPRLLQAGLEPSLLLQPNMLEDADGDVLNYLLAFVNWSTLCPPLKLILDHRLEAKSWSPHACFESVPCLSHLCRLKVREVMGWAASSTTAAVQQLPVPSLLHHYLQFSEIQPPPGVGPVYPIPRHLMTLDLIEYYRQTHMHRHVL